MQRILWLAWLPFMACSSSDDCGEPMSEDANAPRLTEFSLLEQLDGDPWTLIFAVGFTDGNGDAGTGTIEFFLNGANSDATAELDDLFRQAGLATTATSGRIAVPLRFAESVDDGASVRLAIQFVDATELRSNCYSLRLDFDVSQARMAAAGACRLAALQGIGEGATRLEHERRVVSARSSR